MFNLFLGRSASKLKMASKVIIVLGLLAVVGALVTAVIEAVQGNWLVTYIAVGSVPVNFLLSWMVAVCCYCWAVAEQGGSSAEGVFDIFLRNCGGKARVFARIVLVATIVVALGAMVGAVMLRNFLADAAEVLGASLPLSTTLMILLGGVVLMGLIMLVGWLLSLAMNSWGEAAKFANRMRAAGVSEEGWTCPDCQTLNEHLLTQCVSCGKESPRKCPVCGVVLAYGAKYCGQCGAKW